MKARKSVRSVETPKPFVANDVWAASAYAFRVNGFEYVSAAEALEKGSESNFNIVKRILQSDDQLTAEDYAAGEAHRQWARSLTFKLLAGKITIVERATLEVAEKEEFFPKKDGLNISTVCFAPMLMKKSAHRDAIANQLESAKSTAVGAMRERISGTFTVLRSAYSQKWERHVITAINKSEQVVWFFYSGALKEGQVVDLKGTVKQINDQQHSQLNRVVIQES